MSVADNFVIRRNVYWWASVYEREVTFHGERHGSAVWCAFKYINRLVCGILRRKARVDAAVAEQIAIRDAMPEDPLPPPESPPPPPPSVRADMIDVRLVSALTGEVYCTVPMSRWQVVGDAIAKANRDLDLRRRAARASGPEEPGETLDEDWRFVAVDESATRCRFPDVLAPGQKIIDVRVWKSRSRR